MATGARRLTGSGIGYLVVWLLYVVPGCMCLGIIQNNDFPKGTFMAIVSTALGIFDVIIGGENCFPGRGVSLLRVFKNQFLQRCALRDLPGVQEKDYPEGSFLLSVRVRMMSYAITFEV